MGQTKLTLDLILECEKYALDDMDGDISLHELVTRFTKERGLSEAEAEVLGDIIETRLSAECNPWARTTLKVSLAKQYGNETIHPECNLSRGFASLLGQKTLTRANVESIKALGFKVRTISETL
jgi:hypothetical protein